MRRKKHWNTDYAQFEVWAPILREVGDKKYWLVLNNVYQQECLVKHEWQFYVWAAAVKIMFLFFLLK